MTSPASGSTVRGTVTVSANVSDVLVEGVQFQLDGAPLGAVDTTAPYSVPWDTADGDLPAERELSTLVLVQALPEAHGGGRLPLRLSHRPAAPSCRRRPEG